MAPVLLPVAYPEDKGMLIDSIRFLCCASVFRGWFWYGYTTGIHLSKKRILLVVRTLHDMVPWYTWYHNKSSGFVFCFQVHIFGLQIPTVGTSERYTINIVPVITTITVYCYSSIYRLWQLIYPTPVSGGTCNTWYRCNWNILFNLVYLGYRGPTLYSYLFWVRGGDSLSGSGAWLSSLVHECTHKWREWRSACYLLQWCSFIIDLSLGEWAYCFGLSMDFRGAVNLSWNLTFYYQSIMRWIIGRLPSRGG